MQTALVSIDANMKNVLRDEAVSIAEQRLNEARSLPFDSIVSDAAALPAGVDCPGTFADGKGERVQRNFRNIINKDFCSNMTVTDLGINNKQANIRVIWNWKGEAFMHSITTLIRRPD
jgi:hypothetical protein